MSNQAILMFELLYFHVQTKSTVVLRITDVYIVGNFGHYYIEIRYVVKMNLNLVAVGTEIQRYYIF